MIDEIEATCFSDICREVLCDPSFGRDGRGCGIGTYKEKRMHAALKRFICPDLSCHEVDMGERYVADALLGDDIYEIQTGSFFPLSKKLDYYMKNTDKRVTVVHPIAVKKKVIWIDPESGEARSSPARRDTRALYKFAEELIYLSEWLGDPRLRLELLLISEEEYRYLDGWSLNKKRGSHRYERLPVELDDRLILSCPDDFSVLLPPSLGKSFTAAEYEKAVSLRRRRLWRALNGLCRAGVLWKDERRYLVVSC